MRITVWVISVLFLFDTSGWAAVVSIAPSRDNSMFQESPGNSNGVGQGIFVGTNEGNNARRGLIHFDIAASVPADATIDSVSLQLFLDRTSDTLSRSLGLHQALAQWGEAGSSGSGAGAVAQAGDATWSHRLFNTNTWTSPGGDFNPVASASVVTGIVSQVSVSIPSNPVLVGDVREWLDSPAANFGWLLRGDETVEHTARRFASREFTQENRRPLLTIEYTPVPEPTSVLAVVVLMGFLRRSVR